MSAARGVYFDTAEMSPTGPKVLLVEGTDEAFFFDRLLQDMAADPEKIRIFPTGGKDNLHGSLGGFVKSAPFRAGVVTAYAIVQDADSDPNISLNAIHGALRGHAEPTPANRTFEPAVQPPLHHVGIFLLPPSGRSGNLDTLCLNTLDAAPLLACVDAYIECANGAGAMLASDLDKRRTQVYLASRAELCRGAGRGYSLGYFDANHASLEPLKAFIGTLIAI